MEKKKAIILFADIQGSTEFGFTQPLDKYNEMLRDFHKTALEAVKAFRMKHRLDTETVVASCRGDECCIFLMCGSASPNELLAVELAVYVKEKWKASNFCKLNWQASDTGMIPQVDLRIGIGSGDVALDDDAWSKDKTMEGIVISEAKRIEGMADQARETLMIVKWDVKEACVNAGADVVFGNYVRLKGKGIPEHHDIPLYPVVAYKEWQKIQAEVAPSTTTVMKELNRAIGIHLSGDHEGAIKAYTAVLKRDERLASAWMGRGAAHDNLKRYEEALSDYNRSLKLRPDHPDTLNNRGNTYDNLKRYEEALSDYNRSLKLRPDDPATLNNRGNTYDNLKRYEEALSDYNRSLELRPDDPATLNNRGSTYDNLKRYEEALSDYNRSLKLRPDHPATLYNLSCLFSVQKKIEEALEYLRKAIKGDERYRNMAREDKDFDNIKNDARFKRTVGPS